MKYNKAQFIWGPGATDKLTFDLDDINPSTPYVVKAISGLEPPPIDLSISDRLFEGGVYQGRRPQNREIVMLMSFQPNYSNPGEDAGTLRKKLYLMLSPRLNHSIRFRLLDDMELDWVEATGYIKRMENNIFSKDPEVQITMSCLSAYFNGPEFIEPSPAVMGGKTNLVINNTGDVPTGFILDATLTAAASGWRFRSASIPAQDLWFVSSFLSGDRIVVNTNPGSRSAKRIRAGVADFNLLGTLSAESEWWLLDPGSNSLTVNVASFTVNDFRYTPKHWGF